MEYETLRNDNVSVAISYYENKLHVSAMENMKTVGYSAKGCNNQKLGGKGGIDKFYNDLKTKFTNTTNFSDVVSLMAIHKLQPRVWDQMD